MKILELTQQLTDNHLLINVDLPNEYRNKAVRIMVFPFDDIMPVYNIVEKKPENKKKELWFLDLKGTNINHETFRREDMYDDWGR